MIFQNIKNRYCHYLLKSQVNYTCTNMADHVDDLSHDKINRFLANNAMDEKHFYEQLYLDKPLPSGGYLIFDDTVLDKTHSHQIEMVRRQYSGNAGGIIKGIGIVNMLYYIPNTDTSYLLGFRFFDPDLDNKTKIDHVLDMIRQIQDYSIDYQGVLMDTWYAVSSIFQLINSYSKYFYCPLKSNRLAKQVSPISNSYQSVGELSWNKASLSNGQRVKIKNLDMTVNLYKVTVSSNRTDHVLTNDLRNLDIKNIETKQKIRWKIETLHRELKQLTGIEKCQCRKAPSQRTHIFCAMLVWNKLKEIAYQTLSTLYQVKVEPMKQFLINQLSLNCPNFA